MTVWLFVKDWLGESFKNLSFGDLSFPREPVLWLGFIAALLLLIADLISGGLGLGDFGESLGVILAAFLARGKVTPTPG